MRRHRARLALAGIGIFVVATGLAACSGDGGGEAGYATGSTHVHAMAPGADGEILIGTHHGLVAVEPEGGQAPHLVSEHRHDFMGLAADGSGRLLGSGHPDLESGLPPHIGLVDSADGVRWEEVALTGVADFHALAANGDRIYGWDSVNGRFLASDDAGESFSARSAPEALHWLAVDPEDPEHVLGASEAMLYASADGGRSWRSLERGGGLLTWPTGGDAVLLEYGSGRVLRSPDGRGWSSVGTTPFDDAVALTASGETTLAAATQGGQVWVSDDAGASWSERASVSEIPE